MVPAVASIPTCRLRVISPIHSAVGRMTPSTLRVASITGRLICWMVRKGFLPMLCCMPISPKGHPSSNSLLTACRVKFVKQTSKRARSVRTACAVSQNRYNHTQASVRVFCPEWSDRRSRSRIHRWDRLKGG